MFVPAHSQNYRLRDTEIKRTKIKSENVLGTRLTKSANVKFFSIYKIEEYTQFIDEVSLN